MSTAANQTDARLEQLGIDGAEIVAALAAPHAGREGDLGAIGEPMRHRSRLNSARIFYI
ncbi:hypothetical protein LJR220_002530 [Bradyrhizobium sp. LjRoot220]|uniref:hypothetical protein n=1 Tax=Bradyrhizobium sp. LjRoot220 TaxID=3342284 RepID=UPI003ECFC8C7